MVSVGRRPAAPSTAQKRDAGEACAPQTRSPAPEAPLPRVHHVAQPPACENAHGLIGRLGAFFRKHEKPVAAVIAGASAMPLLAGASIAQAAPNPAPPQDPGRDADSVELAHRLVFGAVQVPASPPRPEKIDRGTAALLALREELIRKYFAPDALTGPGPRPIDTTPVQEVDKQVAADAIRSIDTLLSRKAQLPSGLVGDLERLRSSIARAEIGTLSGKHPLLDVLTRGGSDAQKIVDGYAKAAGGIDKALPSLPNTTITLPFPASFTQDGATIAVPAGTTISTKGGAWRLDAPGLTYTGGGTAISAGRSTIVLGSGPDALHLETLKVTDGASNADLTGVGATVDRAAKTATITADRAVIDLAEGHFELEGAKLGTSPAGTQLSAKTLSWSKDASSATITGLDASSDAAGARMSATGLTLAGKDGTALTASQAIVEVTKRADGGSTVLVSAAGATVDLAKGAGKIAVEGGNATASYGADGKLEKLEVRGDKVSFASGNGRAGVTLNGAGLVVTPLANGGQKLSLTGKDAQLELDGHKVDVQGMKGVTITTDAQGKLQTLDAKFPGPITFEQKGGDLKVVVTGLDLRTRDAGTTLRARFDEAAIRLESEDLTAAIRGVSATITPGQVRVHVDSAELTRNLGDPLAAKVDGVDLIIDKNAKGGISALDLKLAGFEGKVKGFDIFARTSGGDRIRLHVEADETGKLIREAFLQIPAGGEIKIEKKDLSVTLGPQTFGLVRDASGAYTISAKDLDVAIASKDTRVRVDGGTAKVKLDPAFGRLVIEEVHGTRVDVKSKGISATIDIQKLDGFLFKMTGVEGAAKGAAIHLVPTSDASRLDVTIHAKVKGIPVVVELDGLHQLDASASAGDNQAHVYVGDPTGHGKVKIGVGPIEMKGSAIEIYARYQTYDSGRMFSLVNRYLSTDGVELVRGLTVEPDGVVRLGTRGDGLKAEVAVLLPRGTGSTPLYVIDPGDGAKDGATGVVVSLGAQGRSGSGATHALSAFGGLVPGSYVDWRMTQGHMSVLGVVPLPDEMKIPSTAIGGLTYERKTDGSKLGVSVGGYVNPAGLAKAPGIIDEPRPYGVFGGVHLRTRTVDLGADALVDLDAGGKPAGGGGRLTLGVSF